MNVNFQTLAELKGEPATLTLKRFAQLFGKSYLWAYRLAKSGKLKTITGYGCAHRGLHSLHAHSPVVLLGDRTRVLVPLRWDLCDVENPPSAAGSRTSPTRPTGQSLLVSTGWSGGAGFNFAGWG